MNWSEVESNWRQLQFVLRSYWPKLTDDDLRQIDGDRNRLASVLERRYGLPPATARCQICEFEKDARFPGAVK